jgi:hypothetical protein
MVEEEGGEVSVTVVSVSSPGDTELTDTSGGLNIIEPSHVFICNKINLIN